MTRTSGMSVGAEVRERLRAAQRAESEAVNAVQKAQAADADARARLDELIVKHQVELSKTARAVQGAKQPWSVHQASNGPPHCSTSPPRC